MQDILLLETDSINNPLAQAWVDAFNVVGIPALGWLRRAQQGATWLPGEQGIGPDGSTWLSCDASELRSALRMASLSPTCVFTWWGLRQAAKASASDIYPKAKRVLCVDTYPDSSRLVPEVLEWGLLGAGVRSQHTVVTYSPEMASLLRRRHLISRQTEVVPLLQPFPLRYHSRKRSGEPISSAGGIFTGRSDFLFSRARNMAKDAVGAWLRGLVLSGVPVTVQETGNAQQDKLLRDAGLGLYKRQPAAAIFDGSFADFVSAFEFQVARYAVPNRTVERRVGVGLSSRFALGATAMSPIVIPHAASSSLLWLRQNGIGGAADTPSDLAQLRENFPAMRNHWAKHHVEWSAEGQAARLLEIAA